MRTCRRSRRPLGGRTAVVALMVVWWAGSARAAPPRYDRPDATTIRAHTRDILDDPRFQARITFRQWLQQKLVRWFGSWEGPGKGWGRVLVWVFVVWAALTLLAILAHIIWVFVVMIRSGRYRRGGQTVSRYGISAIGI